MRVSLGPEMTLTTCWLALQHALPTQPVRPIGLSDLPFPFTSYHITRTSSRFGTRVFMMILLLFLRRLLRILSAVLLLLCWHLSHVGSAATIPMCVPAQAPFLPVPA